MPFALEPAIPFNQLKVVHTQGHIKFIAGQRWMAKTVCINKIRDEQWLWCWRPGWISMSGADWKNDKWTGLTKDWLLEKTGLFNGWKERRPHLKRKGCFQQRYDKRKQTSIDLCSRMTVEKFNNNHDKWEEMRQGKKCQYLELEKKCQGHKERSRTAALDTLMELLEKKGTG